VVTAAHGVVTPPATTKSNGMVKRAHAG